MTNEEILQVARECRITDAYEYGSGVSDESVITFARRIAAMQRNECAAVCDDMVLYTGFDCAAAIREQT